MTPDCEGSWSQGRYRSSKPIWDRKIYKDMFTNRNSRTGVMVAPCSVLVKIHKYIQVSYSLVRHSIQHINVYIDTPCSLCTIHPKRCTRKARTRDNDIANNRIWLRQKQSCITILKALIIVIWCKGRTQSCISVSFKIKCRSQLSTKIVVLHPALSNIHTCWKQADDP